MILNFVDQAILIVDKAGKIKYGNEVAEMILQRHGSGLEGTGLESFFDIRIRSTQNGDIDLLTFIASIDSPFEFNADQPYQLTTKMGKPLTGEITPLRGPTSGGSDGELKLILFNPDEGSDSAHATLMQTNRFQNLGVLISGVAHDFNNILMSILGNISLSQLELNNPKELELLLREAETSVEKAQKLTQQLLRASKSEMALQDTSSIKQIIQDCAMVALSGTNVNVSYQIGDNLCPVVIDSAKMSQVFNSIIQNSVESMSKGGYLEITCQNTKIDSTGFFEKEDSNKLYQCSDETRNEGEYLEIAIFDRGEGIVEEDLLFIFEPFFTTKHDHQGMGLWIAKKIITQHKGYIFICSHPGEGTSVKILLPKSDQKKQDEMIIQFNLIRGQGRILVMDDDPKILNVVQKFLSQLGYSVETASRGEEAIEKYQAAVNESSNFDIVILDLTVKGGMGGLETLPALQKIDPTVVAVASSGYSTDDVIQKYREFGFAGALGKPYKFKMLSRLMWRLIYKKQGE